MMFGIHLPTLNAVLNGTSAVLLGLGFYFIKTGNIAAHKRAMTGAFIVSSVFLASYLTYHYRYGSTHFSGSGPIRAIYFAILISHTILAAVVAPMAILTFVRALRGRFVEHKKIARLTWPVWIYVSITGVVIYLMLYRFA
jgi:uncharacterized membrane protein YozB (DUF420 family)